VKGCIQRVRTGSFPTLYKNKETLNRLRRLAQQENYIGVQSKAILAETYDQVGKYRDAQELANFQVGEEQLRKLEAEMSRPQPSRDVVRAHAWLLLQCGVSEFRRESGYRQGLDLFTRGIDLISANKGEAIDS